MSETIVTVTPAKPDDIVVTRELTFWERTKAWFKYSETIFLNRLEVLMGFIIGAFSLMDWSPLLSLFGTTTGMNWKQTTAIGSAMIARGIIGEAVRRRNMTTDIIVADTTPR